MLDVAVIGGGPAGIAAAIYLKRVGFDVTLFEKNEIGGLLLNAHLVENYPGFPDGIKGYELSKNMEQHLMKWKITPTMEEVKQIEIKNEYFILQTIKNQYSFKAVIIATGTKPKKLGIPGEQELVGELVFYEIKNLLPILKRGDTCIVIGGGDAAFDYSLNLANNKVIVEIYFRSEHPKCLSLLEKRIKRNTLIKTHSSYMPIEIKEIKGKPEIVLKSNNETTITKKSDYVLIACGRESNKELLYEDFEKNDIPGLFIAGDVQIGKFRQVGIAVGEGIYAAMNLEMYLKGIGK